MYTRYKGKIKTFMFIEFDDMWYGGMKFERTVKFNDALEAVLNRCTNDSIVECYIIFRDIPVLIGTCFTRTQTFNQDENFKLEIE